MKGFAHQTAYSLHERAVEAFDMLGSFAVAAMTFAEDNSLIGSEQVGVTLSVQITSKQTIPKS